MPEVCVVIGAGPVGLTAALALRRRGVEVLVLEAGPPARSRPGSRAIFLMQPTLRRFEQVLPGLGASIAAEGIRVPGYDAFYGDRKVCGLRMPAAGPMSLLGLGSSLPQRVTEGFLLESAEQHGVQFRWSAPVDRVDTDPAGATVSLTSGEKIRTPYVIAADGARSVARSSLGLELEGEGERDDTPFIIVDVDEHPDGSTPRRPGRFYYRYPQLDGRNVMHMPFAGGMRVDLQCLPSDDAEYLASPAGVREWLGAVVDPWYAEHVTWVSTYRFHQSVARSYTDDHHRVLLAGEAAHLFAPWGGRGLNSGVFDATDAADAVAGALAEPRAARRLIARCAADRRKWGLHNRDVSSRALRRMRAGDPGMQLQRQWAARLAPFVWPAGAWLANGPTQVPVPRPSSLTTVGWY